MDRKSHQQKPLLSPRHGESVCAPAAGASAQDHHVRVRQLFEAHNRSLLRFLSCRLRSTQEAMEVAQEAYVRMLQLDAPDGIGYLRAFLFKTAANLAADRVKSATRRDALDQLNFFSHSEPESSAEAEACAEEALATILGLCEQLPARCRYAFVMHRFHGHSIQEVARLMNLSTRMVQIYVERALVFCREGLRAADRAARSPSGESGD